MSKSVTLSVAGAFLVFVTVFSACREGGITETDTIAGFKKHFADPPSEFRSAPLWDWNEQISEEGIDFHLKEFKKAGIGGVFVHPRPGLLTEYLSEEWFRLFDYTVQKGKELGMKVWIYDENSYPSGFAGGHVPAEMADSYRHGTGLKMEILEELNFIPSDTIEVILRKTESGFEDITKIAGQESGKPGTYYFFRKSYPGSSPWYGGFTYVDLLYPGVTAKFMDLTMTRGYEKSRADFGKTLPGIFTDEPNLEAAMSGGTLLRWTPGLWEDFSSRWGYDLRVHLPSLVEETGDWKKVRHDYFQLILELFIDRWAKPWSSYCDANNLSWTGHYWEHGWPEPTHGFDEAAFYIYHQMPGVDMLGNRMDSAGLGGQFGNERAVREARSVANQAGRKRILSETYGGGGWDMDFETQKRLLDWQCVMGINFVNQHLSFYSMNGVRKFDYPPSFTYHEPWWNQYRLLGDYIGRVSMAMSAGEQVNSTLLLQPNTTAWMYFSRKERNPAIEKIRQSFKHLVYRMEQKQLEYDLGSEFVLKTLGSVENGLLKVGQRNYKLVLIPSETENINRSTLDLLGKYLEGGGKLIAFTRTIPRVDGEISGMADELAARFPGQWMFAADIDDQAIAGLLAGSDFSMKDLTRNGMLYHQRRILKDGQLLFVVNSHELKQSEAEIAMEGKYVSRFDLVSGEITAYPSESREGKVVFKTKLEPSGSALYAITSRKPGEPDYVAPAAGGTKLEPEGTMEVSATSDNILVINYLDLKTTRTELKDVYFMQALQTLYRENGVEIGNPWQHKIQYRKNYLALDSLFGEDSRFEVFYHFRIDTAADISAMASVKAVVERPAFWEVRINGNPVSKTTEGYFVDREFPFYEIGRYLKPGENVLALTAPRMHILAEVVPVYLTGNFLLMPSSPGFEITNGKITGPGSWQDAGMPFYSQKVAYTQHYNLSKTPGTRYTVKPGKWKGSVAEVFVNGNSAGLIAWQPYELDITPSIRDGENEIVVEVTGSLKNTFGLFYKKDVSWIYGPTAWNHAPEHTPAASEYVIPHYGLFEPFGVYRSEAPEKDPR